MKIDNLYRYEKGFVTELGRPHHEFYYFFDFDDRSANINMEFQHFHQFYEIHLLLDKEANHIIEGNLFHVNNFDMILMPPSKLHKSQYPEGPAVKRLIINFQFPAEQNPELQRSMEKILSTFFAPIPIYRFEREVQEQLAHHINAIFHILKGNSEIKMLQVHAEFQQFLACLYDHRDENIYNQITDDNISSKIYAITSYIHAHYAEDLSLELLSKEFYISTYYLSHQFKLVTGFTITNYIQMTRIRNAQQMLISGHKKITEIAEECGFNSFSQFNRVFNKVCGVAPSTFKANKGEAL